MIPDKIQSNDTSKMSHNVQKFWTRTAEVRASMFRAFTQDNPAYDPEKVKRG